MCKQKICCSILSEMWLDPKYSVYGVNYASGRVLLGLARGNENLVNATDVSEIYDSRRLDFGVRMGTSPNITEVLVSRVHEFQTRWTEDFHVYTTIWTSNGFTFLIDGVEVGRVGPAVDGWMHNVYGDRKTAPFDQEVISIFTHPWRIACEVWRKCKERVMEASSRKRSTSSIIMYAPMFQFSLPRELTYASTTLHHLHFYPILKRKYI